MSSNSDLGSLKLTLQKFYRINGGSTQLKGVTPDVVIPDKYEYLKMREKDNQNALPWDEVSKATYNEWKPGYDMQTIKNLSNQRINSNPSFTAIRQGTEWLSKQNEKVYPLQLDKYRQEQKMIREAVQKMDTALTLKTPMKVSFLAQDSARYESKDKGERYNQWLKSLSKDIYVDQAVKVIGDIRQQQALAANKQEAKSF
jgi:carboxyl-terminal processing protease